MKCEWCEKTVNELVDCRCASKCGLKLCTFCADAIDVAIPKKKVKRDYAEPSHPSVDSAVDAAWERNR